MDLFDLGCYFAHQVPVQALSNPLLKYSACAYAAKQLGRVQGRKAVIGGIVTQQASMELYPHPETVDWAYIGAKYYDKAIQLLMEELSHSGSPDTPMTPTTVADETFSTQSNNQRLQNGRQTPGNKRRRISRQLSPGNADETLAAAAILCVYEFLDNANTAWARHLSGTKSLFDLAEKEGMMPVQSPTRPGSLSQRITPSRARRATFWNFARQDFLAACRC
jgi:Fungal specific transcription factor domain